LEGVQRLDYEQRAAQRLSVARTQLVLQPSAASVFFSSILMRLPLQPSWEIDTMAVDGKRLIYNPQFTVSLSTPQLHGVLIHEVLHLASSHHLRRQQRDPLLYNVACDLAINTIVTEAGFKLPEGCLFPGQGEFKEFPPHLTAEAYYELLHQHGKTFSGDGSPEGYGGACGQVLDGAISEAERREMELEWKQIVAEATQIAQQKGSLPGRMQQFVERCKKPTLNYREVLRRYLTQHSRSDVTWLRPDRRHVHRGVYLPSLRSESLGLIAVNIDTSGSVWRYAGRFLSEVHGIVEPYACELALSCSDTQITQETTWKTGDGPLEMTVRGGGGTDHHCVFEWANALPETPQCLICLTDLYTSLPSNPPDYPVLWVVMDNPKPQAPWGEIILLEGRA
jgi:predicted metal-dependent peptidase